MAADAEHIPALRRIWIALDTASQSNPALDVAAALASSARAELACLFVEDTDLLRLAALPRALETSAISAQMRPLGFADLERQLRGQAAGIERELARLALGAGLRWSFQVRRGKPLAETLLLAATPDVMVIAGRRLAPALGGGARPLPAAMTRQATSATGARGHRLDQSVVLFLDASRNAMRTLAMARDLALRHQATLEVMLDQAHDLPAAQLDALLRRGIRTRVRHDSASTAQHLAAQARRPEVRLVMSSRRAELVQPDTLRALALELRCPLVLA